MTRIPTGIFDYSHRSGCYVERVDLETKAGRQVLGWIPTEASAEHGRKVEEFRAARKADPEATTDDKQVYDQAMKRKMALNAMGAMAAFTAAFGGPNR